MSDDEKAPSRRREILLVAALTVAFVGFFLGIRQQTRQPGPTYHAAKPAEGNNQARPARSNAELAVRPWSSELPAWQPAAVAPGEPVTPKNAAARERALEARTRRRAFAGAPPTIPHPVSQASGLECQACHREGADIAGVRAPPMSHPVYAACTQCHVPETFALEGARADSAAATVASAFSGKRDAPAPFLYASGSPPQTPHSTFMREDCGSCHGPGGTPGLQTSHPERLSCQQCHAPSAMVDQRPWSGGVD